MNTVTQDTKNLVLLAGRYPKQMKQQLHQVVDELGYTILPTSIGPFASTERFCELYREQQDLFAQNKAEIAGSHVHIVMHMQSDSNKFCVDALNTVATVKRENPASIHLIMPFTPYARQDRAFKNRFVSQMADTFPMLLKAAGVDRVSACDMHSRASEQFYANHLGAENVHFMTAVDLIHSNLQAMATQSKNLVFGGPDGGDKPKDMAQIRARHLTRLATRPGQDITQSMFLITKEHQGVNTTRVLNLQGDVAGKTAVLLDDMIDTGGTLVNAATALKKNGAKQVIAASTHPILSGRSLDRLTGKTIDNRINPIDFLIVSDSITHIHSKVKRLSAAQQDRVNVFATAPLIKQALSYTF